MSETEPRDDKQDHKPDSKTDVNITVGGDRVVCSFRCRKDLWTAFKQYSKTEYGSVCGCLEPILLGVMQAQAYASRTLDGFPKPVTIEHLHITREVKRVRRYERESVVQESREQFGSPDQCCYTNCEGKVVRWILDEPQPMHQIGQYVCERHFLQRKGEIRRARRAVSYRDL